MKRVYRKPGKLGLETDRQTDSTLCFLCILVNDTVYVLTIEKRTGESETKRERERIVAQNGATKYAKISALKYNKHYG